MKGVSGEPTGFDRIDSYFGEIVAKMLNPVGLPGNLSLGQTIDGCIKLYTVYSTRISHFS